MVLARLAMVTLSWGVIFPAATSLSPSFTLSMAPCRGNHDKLLVFLLMLHNSFFFLGKVTQFGINKEHRFSSIQRQFKKKLPFKLPSSEPVWSSATSCRTLCTAMVSGKHPRRPLYSLLVSIRKWRSFLGCRRGRGRGGGVGGREG